jgi:hypothetical protein
MRPSPLHQPQDRRKSGEAIGDEGASIVRSRFGLRMEWALRPQSWSKTTDIAPKLTLPRSSERRPPDRSCTSLQIPPAASRTGAVDSKSAALETPGLPVLRHHWLASAWQRSKRSAKNESLRNRRSKSLPRQDLFVSGSLSYPSRDRRSRGCSAGVPSSL